MYRLKKALMKFHLGRRKNDGQGFIEYLMIIALVGLGLAAALVLFQGQLSTALSTVGGGV